MSADSSRQRLIWHSAVRRGNGEARLRCRMRLFLAGRNACNAKLLCTESTRGQESRISAAYVMPSAEMVSPAAHGVPPQPSSGLLVWNLSAAGCNNAPSIVQSKLLHCS